MFGTVRKAEQYCFSLFSKAWTPLIEWEMILELALNAYGDDKCRFVGQKDQYDPEFNGVLHGLNYGKDAVITIVRITK